MDSSKALGTLVGAALAAGVLGYVSTQSGAQVLIDVPIISLGLIGFGALLGRWFVAGRKSRRLRDDEMRLNEATAKSPRFEPEPRAEGVVAVPGALTVWFSVHQVAGAHGSFVSAITDGLHELDQPELVFSLRCLPAVELPQIKKHLVAFFAFVHSIARSREGLGRILHFSGIGLLGRAHGGLVLTAARAIGGLTMPASARAITLLDEAEIGWAREHGAYRVLARIGLCAGVFPFPTWNDPFRATVCTERDAESVLSRMPRLRIDEAAFVMTKQRLHVSLAPGLTRVFARSFATLPVGDSVALLTRHASEGNEVLVWHPGQTKSVSMRPRDSDGARVTGCCLIVYPGAPDDEARVLEDGYALHLTLLAWTSMRLALIAGRRWKLPMTHGIELELEWSDDSFVPADDDSPALPWGWRAQLFTVANLAPRQYLAFQPEEGIENVVLPIELGEYIRAIAAELAEHHTVGDSERQTLIVECTLDPHALPIIEAKVVPAGEVSSHVLRRLSEIRAPSVNSTLGVQFLTEFGTDA